MIKSKGKPPAQTKMARAVPLLAAMTKVFLLFRNFYITINFEYTNTYKRSLIYLLSF